MKEKKFLLISHILNADTPSYGNRDNFSIEFISKISSGDTANSSKWVFSSNHIGTHIDVPNHFGDSEKKSFEIPLNEFHFDNILIIDIPCNEARLIDDSDFSAVKDLKNNTVELLLIRTGYEKYRRKDMYWNDNPGLAPDLADFLRISFPKLRCVGFDFISLTSWKFREIGKESHRAFLCPGKDKKEILVIEDMALSIVNQSIKSVVVAPLFVADGNGGAVTIFAEV